MYRNQITVEQQIFACRKYSRISADSRKFPAHEYCTLLTKNSRKCHACELPTLQIRENFMSRKIPVLQYVFYSIHV